MLSCLYSTNQNCTRFFQKVSFFRNLHEKRSYFDQTSSRPFLKAKDGKMYRLKDKKPALRKNNCGLFGINAHFKLV